VKTELRALNPINQKRKQTEKGASSESANQEKSTPAPPKSCPAVLAELCGKHGRTNRTTPECLVGTNKYMWYGSPQHLIVTCRQGLPLPRLAAIGRVYVMSKKEAGTSGIVATRTLF